MTCLKTTSKIRFKNENVCNILMVAKSTCCLFMHFDRFIETICYKYNGHCVAITIYWMNATISLFFDVGSAYKLIIYTPERGLDIKFVVVCPVSVCVCIVLNTPIYNTQTHTPHINVGFGYECFVPWKHVPRSVVIMLYDPDTLVPVRLRAMPTEKNSGQ